MQQKSSTDLYANTTHPSKITATERPKAETFIIKKYSFWKRHQRQCPIAMSLAKQENSKK
jgi:hypothetical protein